MLTNFAYMYMYLVHRARKYLKHSTGWIKASRQSLWKEKEISHRFLSLTVVYLKTVEPDVDIKKLLVFITMSPEYQDMRIKSGDKMVLNKLNRTGRVKKGAASISAKIRFPIKGRSERKCRTFCPLTDVVLQETSRPLAISWTYWPKPRLVRFLSKSSSLGMMPRQCSKKRLVKSHSLLVRCKCFLVP